MYVYKRDFYGCIWTDKLCFYKARMKPPYHKSVIFVMLLMGHSDFFIHMSLRDFIRGNIRGNLVSHVDRTFWN